MSEAFDRWSVLKKKSREGGGAERVERHRAAGKLTARDRMEAFFDAGTFTEIDAFVTHRVDKFGMEGPR
jgi:acetyl-CoA carboxylase carboxyltransferase component